MKRLFLLTLSIISAVFAVNAQDSIFWKGNQKEFDINFQLRPRAEYRNGYGEPRSNDSEAAAFISNRARLSLGYSSCFLNMKVGGQHVGTWGNLAQQATDGNFILNEAWANLHSEDSVWFAQFGRQNLSYDDERLLGTSDWDQAGRYHDALKIGYEGLNDKVHLILAFNQNSEKTSGTYFDATNSQPYKSMQTLWYHHDFRPAKVGVSLMAMNLGWQIGDEKSNGDDYMQTLGTHITCNIYDFDIAGSFYYQTGKTDKLKDISAYMWSLSVARPINYQWAVNAGIDFRSGDDGTDNVHNAFNQLYGSHHKFYGAMDYFGQNFLRGLWDPHFGISYTANEYFNLDATYHYFATAVYVNTITDGYRKPIGHEFDFQFNVNIMDDVKLQAGFSTIFGTSVMDRVKGGNHELWQHWGWLSLNLNPQIFKTIF